MNMNEIEHHFQYFEHHELNVNENEQRIYAASQNEFFMRVQVAVLFENNFTFGQFEISK